MKKLLISRCLIGDKCRYDGLAKPLPASTLEALKKKYELIPICPEVMGGLTTPRIANERRENRVIRKDGVDVSKAFCDGANQCLDIAKKTHVDIALLKERSPSCGVHFIYDGSFLGRLIPGEGVFKELLREKTDIKICSEEEIDQLLK